MTIYDEITNLLARGGRGVLVTIVSIEGSVPRSPGAKMLVKEDGTTSGTIGGGDIELTVIQKARQLLKSESPVLLHFDLNGREVSPDAKGGRIDVFFEPVSPPETVHLLGAGHISKACAVIARTLGFHVTVVDPRAELNNKERFPDCEIIVRDICDSFSGLNIGENAYVIIATPSHKLDEDCLHLALGTKAKYIGMVGSKRKLREITSHLIQKGIPTELLDKVHSPIGLDIGAETPEEIALSIMAEVVAVKRGKEAKPS